MQYLPPLGAGSVGSRDQWELGITVIGALDTVGRRFFGKTWILAALLGKGFIWVETTVVETFKFPLCVTNGICMIFADYKYNIRPFLFGLKFGVIRSEYPQFIT